jgi:hypothetical protein
MALQRVNGISIGGRRIALTRARPVLPSLDALTAKVAQLNTGVDGNDNDITNDWHDDNDDSDNDIPLTTATRHRVHTSLLLDNTSALPPSPTAATDRHHGYIMATTVNGQHLADIASYVHGAVAALNHSTKETPASMRTTIISISHLSSPCAWI